MNKKTHGMKRVSAGLLAALLLASSGTALAAPIENGVHVTCDEAYYGTTDYYGNLTEGSVVKSYVVNGQTTLTDYGSYDEVVNLTDGTAPVTENDSAMFRFPEGNVPSHFYFEGKTAKPFATLPWSVSLHYELNGVPTKAEDLAGKTGVVEIFFDAIPNENASEYAKNNYTLEAMAIFNQDDILSLEAPGAQVQLIGNLRTVLFVVLPGEEQHFSIRVGADSFSFGGMTFLMVPATLSQLTEIAKLSERKDDLEENYRKLSGSLDTLLDSMNGISGSLYETAKGLDQLDQARDTISTGKDALYTQADAVLSDIDTLNQSLSGLPGHLDSGAAAVDDTTKALDEVSTALHKLQKQLKTTKDDLDDLEDRLEDLKKDSSYAADSLEALGKQADKVKVDSDKLLSALVELDVKIGGGDITMQGMTAQQIQEALQSADSLHTIYRSVGSGKPLTQKQFLLAALIANGSTAADAQAQLTQAAQITAAIEGLVSQGMAPDAAKAAVYTQAQMTSEQIAAFEAASAKLGQLKTIYAAFSPNGAMDEEAFFAAMLVASQKASQENASAQAKKLLTLYTSTRSMTRSVEDLCKQLGYKKGISGDFSALLEDISDLLKEMDTLSDTADAMVDTLDDTLDAANKLHDVVNKYAPDLKAALLETKDTVSALTNTLTNTHSFLSAFESLMKKAGKELDTGTKTTLEGLAAALRATANSLNTTGDVKSAKQNISEIVENTWDEYTGDTNRLLLIDASAAAESLTDPRNPAPTSVQVLIHTQEIKVEDAVAEEIAAAEAPHTTFFGRIAQMFRDLWAAITGIFH